MGGGEEGIHHFPSEEDRVICNKLNIRREVQVFTGCALNCKYNKMFCVNFLYIGRQYVLNELSKIFFPTVLYIDYSDLL